MQADAKSIWKKDPNEVHKTNEMLRIASFDRTGDSTDQTSSGTSKESFRERLDHEINDAAAALTPEEKQHLQDLVEGCIRGSDRVLRQSLYEIYDLHDPDSATRIGSAFETIGKMHQIKSRMFIDAYEYHLQITAPDTRHSVIVSSTRPSVDLSITDPWTPSRTLPSLEYIRHEFLK